MSEVYPFYYLNTALTSMLWLVQATVFALCMERDWDQWKIGCDMTLYMFLLLTLWCLLIVAFVGTIALDEDLRLGKVMYIITYSIFIFYSLINYFIYSIKCKNIYLQQYIIS